MTPASPCVHQVTDVQRYDHATAVHRGEEIARLHQLLAALCQRYPELRVTEAAVEAAKGARVVVGFDAMTREYVLPGSVR